MHLIKKYANRKLYDTQDKRYVTMDDLAGLIKSGKEVKVVDNETGEDLTAQIVSQLLARANQDDKGLPSSVLMQLLRKGRGTLFGYGKKYVSLWQSALLMSRDEIEKLINNLVSDSEISESEGRNLKKEITGYANGLRSWMRESVDQRVNEALEMMNLAPKEQVSELSRQVEMLTEKVKRLEARLREKDGKQKPRGNAGKGGTSRG